MDPVAEEGEADEDISGDNQEDVGSGAAGGGGGEASGNVERQGRKAKKQAAQEGGDGEDKANGKSGLAGHDAQSTGKISDVATVTGEEAAALHKKVMSGLKKLYKGDDSKLEAFKKRSKAFGKSKLSGDKFVAYLQQSLGHATALKVASMLARLIPQNKKRYELLKACTEAVAPAAEDDKEEKQEEKGGGSSTAPALTPPPAIWAKKEEEAVEEVADEQVAQEKGEGKTQRAKRKKGKKKQEAVESEEEDDEEAIRQHILAQEQSTDDDGGSESSASYQSDADDDEEDGEAGDGDFDKAGAMGSEESAALRAQLIDAVEAWLKGDREKAQRVKRFKRKTMQLLKHDLTGVYCMYCIRVLCVVLCTNCPT
jgi:hypothetical protein